MGREETCNDRGIRETTGTWAETEADRRTDRPRPDLDLGALCWEQLIKSEPRVEINTHLIRSYS